MLWLIHIRTYDYPFGGRLFSLLVRLSTFNVLYSLYFFCLTQISQISQRTHRILAFAVRMVRSPFTVHHSPFIVLYFLYFLYSILAKRSTNNAFF